MFLRFLIPAILGLQVPGATTYSSGAPAEGCWSDRPLHSDFLPQNTEVIPYRVSINATVSYKPLETVEVTIDSPLGLPHKGFLLRLVSSGGHRGGQWAVASRLHRYNPECGVTHKDARARDRSVVLWRAPSELRGDLGRIQFKAVVVQNMSHFWDNILSDSLRPEYPVKSRGTMRQFQSLFSPLETKPDPQPLDRPSAARPHTGTSGSERPSAAPTGAQGEKLSTPSRRPGSRDAGSQRTRDPKMP